MAVPLVALPCMSPRTAVRKPHADLPGFLRAANTAIRHIPPAFTASMFSASLSSSRTREANCWRVTLGRLANLHEVSSRNAFAQPGNARRVLVEVAPATSVLARLSGSGTNPDTEFGSVRKGGPQTHTRCAGAAHSVRQHLSYLCAIYRSFGLGSSSLPLGLVMSAPPLASGCVAAASG